MLDLRQTMVQGAFAPVNTTVWVLLYLRVSIFGSQHSCWKQSLHWVGGGSWIWLGLRKVENGLQGANTAQMEDTVLTAHAA